MQHFYMPVLKFKRAEYVALHTLKDTEKDAIMPFFELPPLTYDHAEKKVPKTLEEQIEKSALALEKHWSGRAACIDGSLIENTLLTDGTHSLTFFFNLMPDKLAAKISPVLSTKNSPIYKEAVKNLVAAKITQSACIKTYLDDYLEADFAQKLVDLVAYIGLEPTQIHLVIDLKKPENFSDYENFSLVVLHVMSSIPYYMDWQSLTLCGSAFPNSMSEVKSPGQIITRHEWLLYKKAISLLEAHHRVFNFGDYGISNTEYTEFQPKFMKGSASIKYTIDNAWYITKGTVLKTSADFQQFITQSQYLLANGILYDESYSDGDEQIHKYANGKNKSTGNPSIWKQIGLNHHFTKVLKDLSATPGASLALV